MRKNGFTLIELLAVIVILAIIALIATPIILGIINDAREKANERSVELYASAVKNGIAAYQLREGKEVLPDTYTKDTLPFDVEYDGNVECDTIVIYEDGGVHVADCKVNGTAVEYTYGNVIEPICTPVTVATTGNIPEGKFQPGDEYNCKVDPDKEPYTFFVLPDTYNDGKVRMILSANVNKNGEPITSSNQYQEDKGLVWSVTNKDYTDAGGEIPEERYSDMYYCEIGNSCAGTELGPITALNYVVSSTSKWRNLTPLNEDYTDEGARYGTIKLTGQARLPKKEEMLAAGCVVLSGDGYSSYGNCPLYLVDYTIGLSDKYPNKNVINNYGYWTLASGSDEYAQFYSVNFYGAVYYSNDPEQPWNEIINTMGVRPVITLSKTQIK